MHSKRLLLGSGLLCLIAVLASVLACLTVQAQAQAANSDPTYLELRNLGLGKEAVLTEGVVLKREFATFTFRNGTMFFSAPVNGKVTGAVFVGEGSLALHPNSAGERSSLSLLSKSPEFNERFDVLVLRFTDGTYDELKQSGPVARDLGETDRAAKALADNLEMLRNNRLGRYNISARILQDLLATSPGGFFAAYIHGNNYNDKEVFMVDPQGLTSFGLQPEEVAFATYDENKYGLWAAAHLEKEYANGTAKGNQINGPIDIQSQKLEAEFEKSAEMRLAATTTFAAARNGIRVAPFSIFRNFKIQSVTDASGNPLPYIFEQRSWNEVDRDDADNFNVILPKPLATGEKFTLKIELGGKEAVRNTGGGNYSPVAREDWFPSTRLGDYATYEMTFRIPKGMNIAATGTLVSEKNEGDWNVTQWKTEVPIGVAGFNFGRFKGIEQTLKDGLVVQAYANTQQPDWVSALQNAAEGTGNIALTGHTTEVALGTMDTTTMMKKPMAEAALALQLYADYFGPLPYKRLSITQQTACNYGQAWPGLVWLPICSFFDSTVRHQLGIDDTRQPYWNVVAPHEVAHEWWGHTVGWASYRDQWMSEGFAQLSASIFVQTFYPKDKDLYARIWRTQQKSLQEKNQFGFRPIDIGPLTMGFRVNSSRTGDLYSTLIYDKGSFVLHMLRMMMWDRKTGDQNFKEMMRDFVSTYSNRPASTEDFKAMVEKHITPAMNVEGNGKMDWFFDEWVYGTELPKYDFTYNVSNDSSGEVLNFKLTQSNVSPGFRMLVPLYAELSNGAIIRLGSAFLKGNSTVEQKVALGSSVHPKRLMINYYYDVLSAM